MRRKHRHALRGVGQTYARMGRVVAFEAQQTIFYALAGNIVINNCLNVRAMNCAVGHEPGSMKIPKPDYLTPSSYGSLELRRRVDSEFIGQAVDYDNLEETVPVVSIDSLNLDRIDFVKLDIEGMEEDALHGAEFSLKRHKPILVVEAIKSDVVALSGFLDDLGYALFSMSINILAVHKDDPVLGQLDSDGNGIWLK